MNGSSAAEGFARVPERVEQLSHRVIGSALKVHKDLGPGLIESIYERCLCYEFQKSGLEFERQVAVPVVYDGVKLDADLRLDIWVERLLIVEVKAVETTLPIHQAQLMTYLKLTGNRLGLLINFNVALLKSGIKRVIF